jgi:hypothetical protein
MEHQLLMRFVVLFINSNFDQLSRCSTIHPPKKTVYHVTDVCFATFCVCASALHLADCIDRYTLLNFHPPGPLFKFELRSFCLHTVKRTTYKHTHTRCGRNIIMQMSQVIDWRRKHKQLGA